MKQIKRVWRDWELDAHVSPEGGSPHHGNNGEGSAGGEMTVQNGQIQPRDSEIHTIKQNNSTSKSNNIKRYKELHKVTPKKNFGGLVKANSNKYDLKKMYTDINKSKSLIKRDKTAFDFMESVDMSRSDLMKNQMNKYEVNLDQAKSEGINIKTYSKNKKLSRSFAIAVDKLSEYRSGYDIIGEDFWDMDELAKRCISKRSVNRCKKSRTKETVTLLLDSSPSCAKSAGFFASIASVAIQYDFLELYDAPNMRIIYHWNKKSGCFEPAWDADEINDEKFMWNHWRNKNIIVFTDSDGFEIIADNCTRNQISYFSNRSLSRYSSKNINKYKNNGHVKYAEQCQSIKNNCKLFPHINTVESFVAAVKTIR